MNFRIVTTASYSYAPVVEFCLPSWRRNSGADDIVIRWHKQLGEGDLQQWLRAVQERCGTMMDAVEQCVADKRKLLLMDADCVVIKSLEDGFKDGQQSAIARWPNINMGVVFLNTDMDWPFVDFFRRYVSESNAHIDKLIAAQSKRCGADQDIFTEMLKDVEDDVAKLDHHVWNFPFSERIDQVMLAEAANNIRILHLRIGTSFGGAIERFGFLKEIFPGVFERI